MIEIVNIKKTFGDRAVLKGVSGRFENGNNSLIIGASGTGKSVLLKCIVGLIQPDEGDVLFDGRSLFKSSINEVKKIRREMGMLFQGSALFDSLSVFENVRFPLDMLMHGMQEAEKNDQVMHSLERVGLAPAAHKMPAEISGGMRKRVGIARAIVMNPKYLFCDEPNSGLDPMTSIKIDELISDITDEFNMTTIVVTHDMNSVMGIGEYVMFLHEGLKEWEGDSNSILHSKSQALREFVFASKIMEKLL
ncbi:MAG TPA: ATP-binding cassette domain-containing protein [Catalimonadaceae bacterium]|nr:ATP-binding cassette domain-containing protein [Catalimonadaceae bacterium]HPI09434.1 ATP-binding cassette domain-containing protein [Catalimonadaceae bacterium]